MNRLLSRLQQRVDAFLFASCSPASCVLLRVLFSLVLIVYVSVWSLDAVRWFSDAGVLRLETAQQIVPGPSWALFDWLPATPTIVKLGLAILGLQSVCLLLGIGSRFQAVCIFFWLVSFQSRNPLICDGEDNALRVLSFCLIFMPLDHAWSLGKRWWGKRHAIPVAQQQVSDQAQAWGLRLLQIHLTLMYLSAAASKALSSSWRDGSALFYVAQNDDMFGRGPLPGLLFEHHGLIQLATWTVLFLEAALPFALWYRRTRLAAVVLGIALHLSMEYAMHLFLFQWIMIVSLLSFVDVSQLARWLRRAQARSEQPA